MRILIATFTARIVGGIEAYLHDLIPALHERGHTVALLTESDGEPGKAAICDAVNVPEWSLMDRDAAKVLQDVEGWRPNVCLQNGMDDPARERDLVERFPTVLFAHNHHGTCISASKHFAFPRVQPCQREFGPACLALYLPRRCGGLNPLTMMHLYRLQRERKALLAHYRVVVAASRYMLDVYRQNGVNNDRLRRVPLFPAGMSPDAGPPSPRLQKGRVLMLGRLTRPKGAQLLIEAIPKTETALGKRLNVTIAGEGPEQGSFEKLAHRRGVDAEFPGWVDAPMREKLMRSADALVMPSIWSESFGLVGIEAGCVGLPAVAFAVGGIPEWLKPGESGELAPADPPTADGLADALVRALRDEAHLDRLRTGAWLTARCHTRERHLDALEAVLHDAAVSAGV